MFDLDSRMFEQCRLCYMHYFITEIEDEPYVIFPIFPRKYQHRVHKAMPKIIEILTKDKRQALCKNDKEPQYLCITCIKELLEERRKQRAETKSLTDADTKIRKSRSTKSKKRTLISKSAPISDRSQ